MFSSQDGAATWTPLDSRAHNKKVQALALDGSTLYAGTGGGGVFKLDGVTWTQVNTGLVALAGECSGCPLQVLSLATDSRSPGTVYAGTEGAGVYKSSDGCELGPAPDDHQPGVSLGLSREGRDPGLARRRDTGEETLYAGAKGSVGNSGCSQSVGEPGPRSGTRVLQVRGQRSTLGSQDERDVRGQIPPTFTLNVYAIAMIGGRIYVGTDFGVFTSDDQAGSWDGVPRMHRTPVASNLVGLPIRALAASLNGTTTTLYAGSVGRGMFKREHTGAHRGARVDREEQRVDGSAGQGRGGRARGRPAGAVEGSGRSQQRRHRQER